METAAFSTQAGIGSEQAILLKVEYKKGGYLPRPPGALDPTLGELYKPYSGGSLASIQTT